ncbi:zinc-dependent alcohol dehydrogenase [Halorussus halobius]|uniref:zinc-dependent alcohol dehydrogenase n=1 Tax=Halorussus halobius TaxID=1710537 RepID=UPI001091BEE7|nr:alcohol dehydrogenase catalytic domain-containing protein [Halorussus halobius]
MASDGDGSTDDDGTTDGDAASSRDGAPTDDAPASLPDETTSMVLTEDGALEPRTFAVPDVSEGGALLEVEMTSVCGTDVGIYGGESHFDTLPLVFGHEVVGRVVAGDDETLDRMGVSVGDRVVPEPYIPCYDCHYCQTGNYHMCEAERAYGVSIPASEPPHLWGGYGEYVYLAPNTKLHVVDEDVPAEAACLGTVVANGVRWILTKGDVDPGDGVAIVGPGAQGLASVVVADEAGADPIVLAGLSDDADRLELGTELGATDTVFVDEDGAADRVRAATGEEGPPVAVVTAPSGAALRLALDVVAPLGTVVLPGFPGEEVEIDADRLVHDEISLLGGRGQALEVERAMGIVERRGDDVASIISHVFPVREAETAIERQLPGEGFDPDIVHAALRPDG